MRWIWNPGHYWSIWLGAVLGTFLVREIWAIATRHNQDTFSDWVWRQLHIVAHQPIGQWSAETLLLFCSYVTVFIIWLPWHFFFRRFP